MGFVKLMKIMVMGSILILPSLLWADPIPIDSIDEVKEKVSALLEAKVNPQHIGVVLDFHGVVTEDDEHTSNPRLKGNIKEVLEYFRNEKVPCVIATAWKNPQAVIQKEIIPLGLAEFFDINASNVIQTEFFLGKDKLRFLGYKNGRVTALKYWEEAWEINPATGKVDPHFRRKAFTFQAVHPQNVPQYLIFVEDNKCNLKTFEEDFPQTIHKDDENFKELILFHLTSIAP